MDKKQIRTSYILQINKKTNEERNRIEQQLKKQLFQSKLWNQSNIIGITVSQGIEWDTREIIQEALKQGKTICVPKSYPKNHKLFFYKIECMKQLEVASYGLLEPIPKESHLMNKELIDLLIVPGIVFDQYGFRIGFGGGYYDRFLIDYPHETCSLFSVEQLVDELPYEAHDIPINYLITETGIQKRKLLNDKE